MSFRQNSGMIFSRRYFYFFASTLLLFFGCLSAVQWTQAAITEHQTKRASLVRGVIVKFKDAAETAGGKPHFERIKSLSSSEREGARQRQNERADRVIADTDLAIQKHRDLGNGHHVMQFKKPLTRSQLGDKIRALQRHPDVAYAEPDELMRPLAVPNDSDYAARQWYMQSSSTNAGATNMETAWNTTTGASSVVVAVLDTGMRPHADMNGRYWWGFDFVTNDIEGGVAFANDGDGRDSDPSDPGDWISAAESAAIGRDSSNQLLCGFSNSSWHGTYVAGLLGAAANNNAGIAGANWGSPLLIVRVAGKCGAYASNIIDGMRWSAGLAVSGVTVNPTASTAKVINLSFGGDGACGLAYQTAINEVKAAGSLVVVAAGNESGAVSRPGNCDGVLTVGAARHDGLKANYSNFGSEIGLMAAGGSDAQTYNGFTPTIHYPGLPMWSLSNTGLTSPVSDTYKTGIGTSFAAPLVSGAASLMLSVNPGLSPQDLMTRLKATSRPHVRLASLYDVVDNVTTTLYDTGFLVPTPNANGQTVYVKMIGTSNCTTTTCGAGLLDAAAAVAAAANPAVNITAVSSAGFGMTVSLNGSASAAATGSTITAYAWTQTAGPSAVIQNANSATASMVIPSTAGAITLQLQVTDSLARSSAKSVTVTARPVAAPTVITTVSGSTTPSSTIGLNGSASYADTSFTITNWSWTQISGAAVSIQNPTSANASVVMPATAGNFSFRLTVTDSAARSSFGDIAVSTVVATASKGGGGGGAISWLWSAGLGLLLTAQLLARFVFARR
jgi:serine protease